MDLSSSTMSPPRSLHAKRWALIKEGSSEISSSQISDNQSPNNDFIPKNKVSGNSGTSPAASHAHDLSASDDDTTMPSAVFSETFNVFTVPETSSWDPRKHDTQENDDLSHNSDEDDPEISTRSKNKKKMLRSPLKTVKKSVNEVLFGTVGMDTDSIEGLFTKDPPEIRRISVCDSSEGHLEAQGSSHSVTNGGLKRRNTTRPKGPGGEPFGHTQGLRSRQENNKCLIEIAGDSDMLDFVESVTAVELPKDPPAAQEKSPLKMNTLNGYKSSLQQCGQSITDDDIPSPLMSSTFINNNGDHADYELDMPDILTVAENVEAMEVVEREHIRSSFSSKDLPIIKKDPPPAQQLIKEEQRNGSKRMHEVDRRSPEVPPALNYSGAKSPDVTSTYSDSEDMYSSDHHSSQ